jgi:hypothetical protein
MFNLKTTVMLLEIEFSEPTTVADTTVELTLNCGRVRFKYGYRSEWLKTENTMLVSSSGWF